NVHLRSLTGKKPFPCVTCDESFSSQYTLKEHTRTHTGIKPYSCAFCYRQFTHRNSIKYHRENCLSSTRKINYIPSQSLPFETTKQNNLPSTDLEWMNNL